MLERESQRSAMSVGGLSASGMRVVGKRAIQWPPDCGVRMIYPMVVFGVCSTS